VALRMELANRRRTIDPGGNPIREQSQRPARGVEGPHPRPYADPRGECRARRRPQDKIRRRIGTAETAIVNEIRDLGGRIDRRLERVEIRIGEIDLRVDSIEQHLDPS
jgi:hypothetical protein